MSDVILDLALETCNEQLKPSQGLIEDKADSGNVSASEYEQLQNQLIEEEARKEVNLDDSFWINFHIFAPPELTKNIEDHEFGIMSSIHEWNPSKMTTLETQDLSIDGCLVTGKMCIPAGTHHFDYKYVLRNKLDGQCIWESLPNGIDGHMNRQFKTDKVLKNCVIEKYDGIVVPEENNVHLLKKYKEQTIRVMINELFENDTLTSFESIKKHLSHIMNSLRKVFNDHSDHFNNKICQILMEILAANAEMSFLYAAAILANRSQTHRQSIMSLDSDNLNAILAALNLDEVTKCLF